jgi:hypothetical protein
VKTRIECGCALQTCTGITGCPGCGFCGGAGYRIVACADCADSGWLFGGDDRCRCEAGRIVENPEHLRLARELAVMLA